MISIPLDRQSFLHKFLIPLSRVSDECRICMTRNELYSLVSNTDGSLVLQSSCSANIEIDEPVYINIKDVQKLVRVIDCIREDFIELKLDDNASVLKYSSKGLSFKLHLVTDKVLRKAHLSAEKINGLQYDCGFELTGASLGEVIRSSVFAAESNKIYLYTKDTDIYADLTNKAEADYDSVTLCVASDYTGPAIEPLPFSLDALRVISGNKPDIITVNINNRYKIISFKIQTNEGRLQYLVPSFSK